MTDALAQTESTDGLTRLSTILNKLTNSRAMSQSDVAGERAQLSAMSLDFNTASPPVAEKLAQTLPQLFDYGSRWIAARMLRDTGLVDETKGAFALTALCTAMTAEKDAGSRYMLAALVRDLGLKHESLSGAATTAIADCLGQEKDPYSRSAEKNSMMAVGMKYEAAGAAAVAGAAKGLREDADPYARILFAGDLRDLAEKWPSQAAAVFDALINAAQEEKDIPAMRHIARHISTLAADNPASIPAAVTALSAGIARETRNEAISAYSHALMTIGALQPMPVIAAIGADYAGFKGVAGKDKRRMAICNLASLGDAGSAEAEAASKILQSALPDEPQAHYRRLIVTGLLTCARNGIDTTDIKEAMKDQLTREKDRETRDTLDRSLRSLGYVRPYTTVVNFPSAG